MCTWIECVDKHRRYAMDTQKRGPFSQVETGVILMGSWGGGGLNNAPRTGGRRGQGKQSSFPWSTSGWDSVISQSSSSCDLCSLMVLKGMHQVLEQNGGGWRGPTGAASCGGRIRVVGSRRHDGEQNGVAGKAKGTSMTNQPCRVCGWLARYSSRSPFSPTRLRSKWY